MLKKKLFIILTIVWVSQVYNEIILSRTPSEKVWAIFNEEENIK